MTEILPTHFVHDQERHDVTIKPDAPYTLFEPVVEHVKPDGSVEQLDRLAVLQKMKEYLPKVGGEGARPGYSYPFGGADTHTVGEVVDSHGNNFLAEHNAIAEVPEAMIGIIDTIAKLAERSGFDRDSATFWGGIMYERVEGNPNNFIHSDGLGGLVRDNPSQAKMVRFVYAIGNGSLIYPSSDKAKEDGSVIKADYLSPSGVSIVENPNAEEQLGSGRSADFTEEEVLTSEAQQVAPGVILAFDPTRTFWHQAPNESRPILVVDVQQAK